jgi:putative esterase
MARQLVKGVLGTGAVWCLRLLAACLLSVPLLSAVPSASASATADDFSRPDGDLGPDWSAISDGGLTISSGAVAGTTGNWVSGDLWAGGTLPADQFSQVEVTSTQLTGSQWIGPAVRAQNNGQDAYAGGGWNQLGGSYASGPLPAGTQLRLTVTRSTISFLQDGIPRITATDTSLATGAPGILAFGTGQVGGWSGGEAGAEPAFPVGGAVSGLSGTVVLQDNGGDSTSVSADGPFAFATPLPSGTPYQVTVRAAPPGQDCTVANGSGTVASAGVTGVAVSCAAGSGDITSDGSGDGPPASGDPFHDDFSRSSGGLGPGWSGIADGSLAITDQAAAGTGSSGISGDIRTAGSFAADQFSQVEVTSTQLTGSQWIGPAVRAQNNGQDAYVGIYYWNSGSPELMLFKRAAGEWSQLGGSYASGVLATGTVLKLRAIGSSISLLQDGVQRITATDTGLTAGAPGIVAFGTGQVGDWSGGDAGFEVHDLGTAGGVESYAVTSASDSGFDQILRVLRPTSPAPGVAHNFLFVLPVEAGLGSTYGDGLGTLRALGAQDQYNLTIIEPSFGTDPWYADNPGDPAVRYETFLAQELVPWVRQNLATTGSEQDWLIGFSKSGLGAQDLLLRHPDVFSLAASWDFPAGMASYDRFGADSAAAYGTDANFQANYRLTASFVDAHKAPLLAHSRIWIGGFSLYQNDVLDYGTLLASEGVPYTASGPQAAAHRWDSGWIPGALAALHQDSASLPPA